MRGGIFVLWRHCQQVASVVAKPKRYCGVHLGEELNRPETNPI